MFWCGAGYIAALILLVLFLKWKDINIKTRAPDWWVQSGKRSKKNRKIERKNKKNRKRTAMEKNK